MPALEQFRRINISLLSKLSVGNYHFKQFCQMKTSLFSNLSVGNSHFRAILSDESSTFLTFIRWKQPFKSNSVRWKFDFSQIYPLETATLEQFSRINMLFLSNLSAWSANFIGIASDKYTVSSKIIRWKIYISKFNINIEGSFFIFQIVQKSISLVHCWKFIKIVQ